VKFLIDAQLPPALAGFLVAEGHEAKHVEEVGLLTAGDSEVWTYAMETGAVIVTKDEDFAERVSLVKKAPGVVWLRIGNSSKRALLLWFRNLLPEIVSELDAGEKLIEIV